MGNQQHWAVLKCLSGCTEVYPAQWGGKRSTISLPPLAHPPPPRPLPCSAAFSKTWPCGCRAEHKLAPPSVHTLPSLFSTYMLWPEHKWKSYVLVVFTALWTELGSTPNVTTRPHSLLLQTTLCCCNPHSNPSLSRAQNILVSVTSISVHNVPYEYDASTPTIPQAQT